MQAYLLWRPTAIDGVARTNKILLVDLCTWPTSNSCNALRRRQWAPVTASAAISGQQNHYSVLGVSPDASLAEIKKAYRLLALKYHPDVRKESGADQAFKRIRLAYDVLSNESTRTQYDRALKYQDTGRATVGNWDYNFGYENGSSRSYRWADLRRKNQQETYREQYHKENFSFYYETDEESDEETLDEERGPFNEVLRSTFLSLFLMYTIGIRLSLSFSTLMAVLDRKLDAGYKIGYVVAWVLGGKGGILLTLCLSFASWLCGKTSSSVVVVVVVAMWVGSNLARCAPLPQGAILALLYMSIKLQVDLS